MNIRHFHLMFAIALATATSAACQTSPGPEIADPAPQTAAALSPDAHVVEVIATDYAFSAPNEIPYGWTTFRMRNEGEENHFIFMTRLPEGKTYDDYVTEVGTPISEILSALWAGEIDVAEAGQQLGASIPAWYWTDAPPMGGPGLVAPGGISQATVRLEPGNYVMECFMRAPEGEFHWIEGMIRPFTVTAEPSGAPEPAADIRVTVTTEGYRVQGEPTAGLHRVAVYFAEQPDVGFGNDIHLVRLEEGMETRELLPWLDLLNAQGLVNPAPAPFLGGTQEMREGHTVYFTVELEPGRYAWIAEGPAARGMVEEFTVR